jgi:hypothetical protein
MTHRITVKISQETEPQAVFTCDEPDTAWCRQNAVGPGEEPPENPLDCWFTVLASGLAAWGKGGHLRRTAHRTTVGRGRVRARL